MDRKKIIFGAPDEFISSKIIEALEGRNFEVINICMKQDFKYPNISSRIKNFVKKTFLNDNTEKKTLKLKTNEKSFRKELEKLNGGKADFALIIRPDLYPKEFIIEIKSLSAEIIGYQWDGLARFPEINDYIPIFDRFFVFDPANVTESTLPLTNFYFETDRITQTSVQKKELFFVGSYLKERLEPLKKLSLKLTEIGYEQKIFIRTSKEKIVSENKNLSIKFFSEVMSYEENQKYFREAGIVLDLVSVVHKGLSFRVFEAIEHSKKLITNNSEVKKYDFYNPSNFYIWKDNTFEGLEEFLELPYQEPSEKIKAKYSFTNWINYVLNIAPHQKIQLPRY